MNNNDININIQKLINKQNEKIDSQSYCYENIKKRK